MNEKSKRIDYDKKFLKQLKKAPLEVKKAFVERFKLFLKEPFHPTLNNHSLTGNYDGFRSINVTGDWRAIYSEQIGEDSKRIITFHFIGTHSQLYG